MSTSSTAATVTHGFIIGIPLTMRIEQSVAKHADRSLPGPVIGD
jgi:hypothetical protein